MSTPCWMCTFQVMVDLPATMLITEMEAFVAEAVAHSAAGKGYPGNVSVQLVATAGSASVIDPTTRGEAVPPADTPPKHDPYAIGSPNPLNGST